jgi:alanine dehydrogenase
VTVKSLGMPRMHKEAGEKRDFLPDFIEKLSKYDIEVVLEYDYGQAMGIDPAAYIKANPKARFGPIPEVFRQDMVMVLRFPGISELQLMKPGSILVSMVHYEMRPDRIESLTKRGIIPLSLDAIFDDFCRRMVENMAGTSWNGMETAFRTLFNKVPDFACIAKPYINVTIIGMGAVGMHAARAASKYGSIDFFRSPGRQNLPGVLVQFAGRTITRDPLSLEAVIKTSDMLVDASKRKDPTVPIIKNDLLGLLPEHAIILDLTADPYNFDVSPYQLKGIEGIPTGSLDEYVFDTNHAVYSHLSKYVDTTHRRIVVSCNA